MATSPIANLNIHVVDLKDWEHKPALLVAKNLSTCTAVCLFLFWNNETQTNSFRYLKFHDWLQPIVRQNSISSIFMQPLGALPSLPLSGYILEVLVRRSVIFREGEGWYYQKGSFKCVLLSRLKSSFLQFSQAILQPSMNERQPDQPNQTSLTNDDEAQGLLKVFPFS